MSQVPLDYSLRAYLEVMFLVPNMSVYVQGTRVRLHFGSSLLSILLYYRAGSHSACQDLEKEHKREVQKEVRSTSKKDEEEKLIIPQ